MSLAKLTAAEVFELECVGENGELFTTYLVAEEGATFSDVVQSIPSLKRTNPQIWDVSRICQISTLADVRKLSNAAHDNDH